MRPEKQLLLDEIKEKITASPDFILTHYSKMDPNVASNFRMMLAKAGGDFEVVKKRILVKAAEVSGFTIDPNLLDGYHVAVVFAQSDPIQITKAVFKFRQEHEEVLEVLGGRFEGRLFSAKDVEQMSKLPSKPEMQAQLLGLFEAVASQTLGVMEALLTSVIYCLDNKQKRGNIVAKTLEQIAEDLSALSVLDMAKLKTLLEEKWGVKAAAAAPMMMAAVGGATAEAAPAAAESTEFQVTLEETPNDKKIGVIKIVREVTGLGLKEAKDMVDGAPKVIKPTCNKTEADEIAKKVTAAGGKVTVKGL